MWPLIPVAITTVVLSYYRDRPIASAVTSMRVIFKRVCDVDEGGQQRHSDKFSPLLIIYIQHVNSLKHHKNINAIHDGLSIRIG